MSTPVFSLEDRVSDPPVTLPKELEGKSATEVAAYYERKLREKPPATKTQPKNEDFWANPVKATQEMIEANRTGGNASPGALTKEDFFKLAEPLRQNMIDMAERLTMEEFADWKDYREDITKVMNTIDPWARTQKHMWKTTYYYIKGQRGSVSPTPPTTVQVTSRAAESGAPAATVTAPEVITLTPDEAKVAGHFGLDAAKYRDYQKKSVNGTFPLTFDNRRK